MASYRLSDYGNAERLVAAHGSEIAHLTGHGWRVWDGRRWAEDRDGELIRRMKNTIRRLYTEIASLDDAADRSRLAKHALRSESEARLRSAVKLASSESAVVARLEEFDRDPFVFNAANGTIDLRTGQLRKHSRGDRLTALSPVAFRRSASDPRWDSFVARASLTNDVAAFLRRAVGYTLTGLTTENKLFFLHGPGATGKTTFLEAMKAVWGDYARTTEFDTFLRRRTDSGPRNDLARLIGARLVVGAEADEGRQLAEGLLKQMTGGDTIAARFLYREGFEYTPTFTVWLASNTRPVVNASDDAMWRRIIQIPFRRVITARERDPSLKDAFRNDSSLQEAVLAWAVRGCIEWQKGGLEVPSEVVDYTSEYRSENDPLAEWLAEECEQGPELSEAAHELRTRYFEWARGNGERPITNREWGRAMVAHGFTRQHRRTGSEWRGVALQRPKHPGAQL